MNLIKLLYDLKSVNNKEKIKKLIIEYEKQIKKEDKYEKY